MAGPPDACLNCGAPAEPGQEYCLQCGSRIVPAQRFSAIGRAWDRRLGRYPGDWIWASLLLLLVAAGSATAGIVAGHATGVGGGPETIVATSPVVTAPPAPPAPKPAAAAHDGASSGAEAGQPAHGVARAERLHGRPRVDPGARHGAGRRQNEGEGRARRPPARRRHPRLVPVREPPPGLLRRLRGRVRVARGCPDGREQALGAVPERLRTPDHALNDAYERAVRASVAWVTPVPVSANGNNGPGLCNTLGERSRLPPEAWPEHA